MNTIAWISIDQLVCHVTYTNILQSVRGSVSLPRLHLISSSRPLFECPTCYSCNDRLPICLWCKSTTMESAAAFWASMPKQRTVSAPKITWTCVPIKSTVGAHGRAKSAEVRASYTAGMLWKCVTAVGLCCVLCCLLN